MKQEITEYQCKRIEEVEEYLADISLKRENLQLIQFSVRRFIRDNHVKEMIVQREAKCGELEAASQVDTQTEFDCREIVLHPTGKVIFYLYIALHIQSSRSCNYLGTIGPLDQVSAPKFILICLH